MADYIFSEVPLNKSSESVWAMLLSTLNVGDEFFSVGKPSKRYTITTISTNAISYKGDDRSGGIPEDINKESFIILVDNLKGMASFNTNTSKELFRKAKISRKRSPMFALLLTSNLIEKK